MSLIRRKPGPISRKPQHINRNLLTNGCMRVWQRGTPITTADVYTNANDSYVADRWILLSDGNDRVDISQETTVVPEGSYASMKFEVETIGAPSPKFGICQILEARDSVPIIGGTCSLSFKARTTSGQVENLRARVMSWSSTADSVTSDFVSSWGTEGQNPTFNTANWSSELNSDDLALTNAFQTFSLTPVDVDTSSTANVGVFIWVDDTDLVVGDVLYITDVKLEKGNRVTAFEPGFVSDSIHNSQRYFAKTFLDTTAPKQNVASTAGALIGDAAGTAANDIGACWFYPNTQRIVPTTTTTYHPANGSAGWSEGTGTTDKPAAVVDVGTSCIAIDNTGTVTDAEWHAIHITVDSEL